MKKPRNGLVESMTRDTLSRVCAVLAMLQNQRLAHQEMRAEVAFGIDLVLEAAIDALEYEGEKIGRAKLDA